jgi:hypothetical protein
LLGTFIACISTAKIAYAEGCLRDIAAAGTILVDATSSCEALGQVGCSVTGDSGTCYFNANGQTDGTVGDETKVDISPGDGTGKTTGIKWQSLGPYTINWVIVNGAAQGGACGSAYEPGSNASEGYEDLEAGNIINALGYLKSNGTIQSVNSVEVCSKLTQPSAELRVKKTATASNDCADGRKLLEVWVDRDPPQGEPVTYCYEITNVGSDYADNVELVDDNGTTTGDDATLDDFEVLDIGTIPPGATVSIPDPDPSVVGPRNVVNYLERGTYINTVTVTGISRERMTTVTASDTATVDVDVAAAPCPEEYQNLINSIYSDPTNGYAASILLEPKNPGSISLCTPTCTYDPSDPNACAATSTRTLCEDDCIWDTDANDCKPSDNWDSTNGEVIDPAGPLPYCFEVLASITNGDGLGLKVKTSQTVEIIELSVNPYVYQTCYKSGGRKVCETICYLYEGETAADCPKGSTVQ